MSEDDSCRNHQAANNSMQTSQHSTLRQLLVLWLLPDVALDWGRPPKSGATARWFCACQNMFRRMFVTAFRSHEDKQKLSEHIRTIKSTEVWWKENAWNTWHLHGFTQVHLDSRPPHRGLGCWTSLMALRGDNEVGDCVYTLHASLLPTQTIRIQKESIRLHTHTHELWISFSLRPEKHRISKKGLQGYIVLQTNSSPEKSSLWNTGSVESTCTHKCKWTLLHPAPPPPHPIPPWIWIWCGKPGSHKHHENNVNARSHTPPLIPDFFSHPRLAQVWLRASLCGLEPVGQVPCTLEKHIPWHNQILDIKIGTESLHQCLGIKLHHVAGQLAVWSFPGHMPR